MTKESISLANGKYTVEMNNDGTNFNAKRYGEEWRDLTGDKLAAEMFYEIQYLRSDNQEGIETIARVMFYMDAGITEGYFEDQPEDVKKAYNNDAKHLIQTYLTVVKQNNNF